MHVLRGQVSGPEDAGAWTLIQIDGDGKLRLAQVGVCSLLIKLRGPAPVAANALLAKPDVDALGIDFRSRVSDGRHEPSPIGSHPAHAVFTSGE